jgi:transcription antitermination protein NusB
MASDQPSRRPPLAQEPGPRHQAREAALHVLYAVDSRKNPSEVDVERCLANYWNFLDGPAPGRPYCDVLVRGVAARRDAVDDIIRTASPNWRIERMARIDRNLLRLGAWEIVYGTDVPTQVCIDEAVEVAREYGAEGAYAFVNGLLDRIARTHNKL